MYINLFLFLFFFAETHFVCALYQTQGYVAIFHQDWFVEYNNALILDVRNCKTRGVGGDGLTLSGRIKNTF